MVSYQLLPLRVAIMNDHASALGVWQSALNEHRPPATVLHVDRHSDLAPPRHCHKVPLSDSDSWAACVDRAGFQVAAAWLGLVDRVWWFAPGEEGIHSQWSDGRVFASRRGWPELSVNAGPASDSAFGKTLYLRKGPFDELHELSYDSGSWNAPVILDIDLDYWGGARGPLQPPWETSALQSCGDLLRECGAAGWADSSCDVDPLWRPLLQDATAAPESGLAQNSSDSVRSHCQMELFLSRRYSGPKTQEYLRKAKAVGLSLPEALLAQWSQEASGCGDIDEERLISSLQRVVPHVVTIARSVDGFMPFHCSVQLEAAVLRILHRAFNRTLEVEYLDGAASIDALRAVHPSRP